jgi:DivIVA domain-containing protein
VNCGFVRAVPPRAGDRRIVLTRRDHPAARAGNVGSHYRSATCRPLEAVEIRERLFPAVRRGLDPTEVYAFLARVAADLAAARAEVARTREENARIKHALRDWQSRFTPGALR